LITKLEVGIFWSRYSGLAHDLTWLQKMNLEGRTVRAENGIEKATNTGIVLRLLVFLKLGGSETYSEFS
jgi:hypothetical protein